MNRRKAILGLSLVGVGVVLTYSGIKTYKLYRKPAFSSLEEHKILLDDLTELIIPRTDTPGAKDAGVGGFVSMMIRECTDLKSQNNFIEGLESVSDYALSKYKKSFSACSVSEQTDILSRYEAGAARFQGFWGKVEKKLTGQSFFETLKQLTVLGYCTSEPGATQGLSYDYIPGKYSANLPLTSKQRAWATQ